MTAESERHYTDVGVAPEAGARSDDMLPLQSESAIARRLGGPSIIKLEFTVAGEADRGAPDRVLAATRRVTAKHGTATRTGSLLEWSSGRAPGTMSVNIAPGQDGTMVMILVDRSRDATVLGVLAMVGAGVTVGLSGTFLEPTGVMAIAGLVLGSTVVWGLAARTVWARSTRRWRRLLARLTAAIADTLEGAPGSPAASGATSATGSERNGQRAN